MLYTFTLAMGQVKGQSLVIGHRTSDLTQGANDGTTS